MSDPTLLEILSLGSDPPSVVPHFQSGLFDSLSNVTFDKVDKTRMLEMFSQQGEKVSMLYLRHYAFNFCFQINLHFTSRFQSNTQTELSRYQ